MGASKSKIDSELIINQLLSRKAFTTYDISQFYYEWRQLNPRDTTDIFFMGPSFKLDYQTKVCLVKVNKLYIISEDKHCERVKLSSKEYHSIYMIL